MRLSDAVTLAAERIVRDEVELGRLSCIELAGPAAPRVFGIHVKADGELGTLGRLFCEIAVELAPAYDKRVGRSGTGG